MIVRILKVLPVNLVLLSAISGCTISPTSNISDDTYVVDEFKLVQKNKYNQTKLSIKSPLATYDSNDNQVEIGNSTIDIFSNGQVSAIVNSDITILDRYHNKLSSRGNLIVKFMNKSSPIILTADSLRWDLSDSIIYIDGNVILLNKQVKIHSSNALYNINKNIIKFETLRKYQYLNNEQENKYIIDVEADTAIVNTIDSSVIFKSNSRQVVSEINFNPALKSN